MDRRRKQAGTLWNHLLRQIAPSQPRSKVKQMPESFIENYKAKHQHPLNKLTHSIGIPLIVISLPLFFFHWRWALGLFVVGWILQFIGHAFEGNQPAFFRNPVYLLVGPWWLLRRAASAIGLTRTSPSK